MNNKFIYKSVAIPLNDKFEYLHATHDENKIFKHLFVGRRYIIDKICSLLKSDKRKRGSYLITGYRGVGKTSVINKAIAKAKNDNQLIIRINLGDNNQLTALNIYFSIANFLREEICDKKHGFFKPSISLGNIILFTSLALATIGILGISFSFPPEKVITCILDTTNIWWLFIFISLPSIYWRFSRRIYHRFKIVDEIDELIERMSNEINEARNTSINYPYFSWGWSKNKKKLPINAREAEDQLTRIIDKLHKKDTKVIFVLDEIDKLSDQEELSEIHHDPYPNKDKNDKISQINTLLGSLKNFVTTVNATFFFISGRETLDRYYSEKGSPNSLYESLFDQVFEIPSLLTDEGSKPRGTQLSSLIEEYVYRRVNSHNIENSFSKRLKKIYLYINYYLQKSIHFLSFSKWGNPKRPTFEKADSYSLKNLYQEKIKKISEDIEKNKITIKDGEEKIKKIKNEISYIIYILRSFIHFLTFHSWGNPKRLNSIFERYIVPNEIIEKKLKEDKESINLFNLDCENSPKYWLLFNNSDKYSFSLTSEIITLFQHQLSREISRISDKLIVSAFSSLHFILKLHPYGFSRETLHLMSETINIYRSPELNTIVDDLLTNVFKPYIKKIRNGMYKYRFYSGFEQELRFSSHVFELESASYNFSLNSMKHVKQFFKDVIENTSSEETNVIARTHIILGDLSSIEQTYNIASEHYSIATRILRNILQKSNVDASRVHCMNYIEVLLKQGDLAEHRQDYGQAMGFYSEAESIAKKYINHLDLSAILLKGDSKWDLLKQPYWARIYLSLKRNSYPRGGNNLDKINKIPNYLYSKNDPRYYNHVACLLFFMGEEISAALAYKTTIKLTDKKEASLPDEQACFLRNYAKIGIIEASTIYHSRKLCSKFCSVQEKGNNNRHLSFLNELTRLAVDNKVLLSEISRNTKISDILNGIINDYENNHLYTSAVITSIKTISFYTTILDSFNSSTITKGIDQTLLDKIDDLLKVTSDLIPKIAIKATRCIDKSRQLESSQSTKTLMINDFSKIIDETKSIKVDLAELIFNLSDINSDQKIIINEITFWQPSLWLQKLISVLLWFNYIGNKLRKKIQRLQNGTTQITVGRYQLPELSYISLKPGILIRWVYARSKLDLLVESIYTQHDEYNAGKILKTINQEKEDLKLTRAKVLFTHCIKYDTDKNYLQDAYEVSRYLYFAVHQSRIISRKNMDITFPRLAQIYYFQWKLLTNLMTVILLKNFTENSESNKHYRSVRDISYDLQKKLVEIDSKTAKYERIPPSYFDYEYIYLRLEESLESSVSLVDRTSRTHMSVFHHKYYCHDDHNDQEFHMDYTLAYMFIPKALFFREKIEDFHNNFQETLKISNLCTKKST